MSETRPPTKDEMLEWLLRASVLRKREDGLRVLIDEEGDERMRVAIMSCIERHGDEVDGPRIDVESLKIALNFYTKGAWNFGEIREWFRSMGVKITEGERPHRYQDGWRS